MMNGKVEMITDEMKRLQSKITRKLDPAPKQGPVR